MAADLVPRSDDFEDLYDNAPCGHVSVRPDGTILIANRTLARWLGHEAAAMKGEPFRKFLNVGGRIFFDTHVAPLLRMQGFFNEFALDMLTSAEERLPAIANAVEVRDSAGQLVVTNLAILKAVDRRKFERELRSARDAAVVAKRESEEHRENDQVMLRSEREVSELREQFIAVLGHDLRNPLASLSAGSRLMLNAKSREESVKLEAMMQQSVKRMSKLIDGVMDFARGRLGGGVALGETVSTDLEPVLAQVIAELASDHPDLTIESTFALSAPVRCDPHRLAQMFSNLLGNAIAYGDASKPIRVRATTHASSFELMVANSGAAIPPQAMDQLFQPFYRGSIRPSKQGLGLGLYIASEIAKSHGGVLDCKSSDSETRFTFLMPMR